MTGERAKKERLAAALREKENREARSIIKVVLGNLTDQQRAEVMGEIHAVFCPHCWRETPDDLHCHCWNDE